MSISLQADYAIRLACDLAGRGRGRFVPVRVLADATGVPYEYARIICGRLVSARILRSKRGPRGGMMLSRGIEEITLLEIVKAVEGSRLPASRGTDHRCVCSSTLRTFWRELDDLVAARLSSTTLSGIAEPGGG